MIKPMLCKLMVEPFNAANWIWERKYDGFRAIAHVKPDGTYTLQARSGTDKTAHIPELKFNVNQPCILDGEIVSAAGLSFQDGIQPRVNRLVDQVDMSLVLPAEYRVFDILNINDVWLTDAALEIRTNRLRGVLLETNNVHIVKQYTDGVKLFSLAQQQGWEGIIGKNRHQGYKEGKRLWVKVKVWQQGTFKVIGTIEGKGKRKGLAGAFALEDTVTHKAVGMVGTGFDDAELKRLTTLVAQSASNPVYFKVKYVEVTNAGQLRFPVYLGVANE